MSENAIYLERTQPTDPLVIRCKELTQEVKALQDKLRATKTELRAVSAQMRVGKCQHCGKEFARARVTRLFCSGKCALLAGGRQNSYFQSDLELVVKHWPVVVAMMTPESVRILEQWRESGAQIDLVPKVGVSRQRINQITVRATRLAKVAELTLEATLLALAQHATKAESPA